MSSKELRGFRYALESAQAVARIRKDEEANRLSKVITHLYSSQEKLSALDQTLKAELQRRRSTDSDGGSDGRYLQPCLHAKGLAHLIDLTSKVQQARNAVSAAELHVLRQRHAYGHAHQRHEMFVRDRRCAESEFVQERQRLASSEADREWLARGGHPAKRRNPE